MTLRSTSLLLSALLFGAALAAPAAHAQDAREQARAAFGAGVSSFEAGEYETALRSFQEAYRLAPHPSVRVNMANCYERLDRPLEAIDHFERFLIEAADSARPAQVREVRARLQELRGRVGEVFFRVTPEGARVSIDGRRTLTTPILDAVPMTAGTHRIEVTADGRATDAREIDVPGGDRLELVIDLPEATAAVVASVGAATAVAATGGTTETETEEAGEAGGEPGADASAGAEAGGGEATPEGAGAARGPSDEGGGPPLAFWIAGGATAAVAITAVATGVMALGAEKDFDDAADRATDPSLPAVERAIAREQAYDHEDRANRLALVTDILMGVTVAGVAASVAILLFLDGESAEGTAATDGPTLTASPAVGPDAAGLVLSGTF